MKENTFKIGTLLKDSQVVKQRIVYVPGCGSKGVTWLGWDEVMYNGKVSSICLVERASGFKPGITYFCVAFKLSEFQFLLFTSSVQFSHSVMSDSLRLHEPQHTRPPYPSPTPEVHPNPCLLSQWCHPAISSSIIPFSSCPQSFPASGSFPMNQLFASGGQSIGVSVVLEFSKYWSFNISPSNEHQGLISFRMDWLDLLAVQRTLSLGKRK